MRGIFEMRGANFFVSFLAVYIILAVPQCGTCCGRQVSGDPTVASSNAQGRVTQKEKKGVNIYFGFFSAKGCESERNGAKATTTNREPGSDAKKPAV
jgi:hypothetical protein